MTRPNGLGIASCACIALSVLPPYANWKQPVNAALISAAFVLAYRAGSTGSRWWWSVCALLVVLIAFLLFAAWRTVELQQ